MIKINKITTKTGDRGSTLGPGMKKQLKCSENINFTGKLDELNCSIGYVHKEASKELKEIITNLQNQLFDIGACFFNQNDEDCDELIEYLAKVMEEQNTDEELNSFLLPQGNDLILALHQSRNKARDAERSFWDTVFDEEKNEINEKLLEKTGKIGIYLNRLSDVFFAMIKKESNLQEAQKWVPLKKRKG